MKKLIFSVLVFIGVFFISFIANSNAIDSISYSIMASVIYSIMGFLHSIDYQLILFLKVFRKKHVRLSLSYLFRIKVDDSYLLIKGRRLNQYQPVGGVFKRYEGSKRTLLDLGVLDDEHMTIDDTNVDDLRVLVPGRNVLEFLKWFDEKKDRETSPEREFREELIDSGFLDSKIFAIIKHNYIKRVFDSLHFSQHFNCWEILISEIYHFEPSEAQLLELRALRNNSSSEYIWISAEQIRKQGYSRNSTSWVISRTSEWIL